VIYLKDETSQNGVFKKVTLILECIKNNEGCMRVDTLFSLLESNHQIDNDFTKKTLLELLKMDFLTLIDGMISFNHSDSSNTDMKKS